MPAFLIYGDFKREQSRPFTYADFLRADPLKNWALHKYNEIALKHIANNTADMKEKQQANHEIEIAVKKQTYWSRHPEWNPISAERRLKEEYKL